MEEKFVKNEMKFCYACGEKINTYAEICPKCGVTQNNINQTYSEEKSLLTTLLLAFIFGFMGIHNFYIKKTVKGVLSIVFSWTYMPLILSLIDIIIMSRVKVQNLSKRYRVDFTDTESTAKKIFFILALIILIGIGIFVLVYAFIFVVAAIFSGSDSF